MAAAPSPSVYVGDLDPQVTEPLLYDHFKNCGPVVSVRVCIDAQTHKSLGYGYVNFQNPADVETAIENMNGTKLLSRPIRVARIQRDPTQRKSGVTNIVIKHLPPETDTQSMKAIFGKYGKISSIRIATDETGKSRGYAYVMFEKEESAAKAVDDVHGMEIDGTTIVVERYRPMHRAELMEKFCNLYVKNLEPSVTEEQLKAAFAAFGEVTSLMIRATEGSSLGFGYVAYAEHEAAAKAVEELDNKPHPLALEGQNLHVRRFESKKERQKKREVAWRERQAQYAKYPNLYVKNFDDTITSDQLKEAFEAFGPTQSVRVMVDRETKVSKGFGFVSFKDHTSAQKAMTGLAGSNILGSRPLFVAYALKKDARRQHFEDASKKRVQRNIMGPMNPMYNAPGAPGMGGYPGGPQSLPLFSGGLGPQPARPPPMTHQTANPLAMQQMAMQRQMMLQQPPMGMIQPTRVVRPQPKPSMGMPPPQPPQPQSLATLLANMTIEQQKNVLGERLYAHIGRTNPSEAAKVTGMLLEMDNGEILNLLEAPMLLDDKVREALDVLRQHAASNY